MEPVGTEIRESQSGVAVGGEQRCTPVVDPAVRASEHHDPHREVRQMILAYYMGDPVLSPGAPVPGCSCKECVGEPIIATITAPGSWEKWSALVDRARSRKIHAPTRQT